VEVSIGERFSVLSRLPNGAMVAPIYYLYGDDGEVLIREPKNSAGYSANLDDLLRTRVDREQRSVDIRPMELTVGCGYIVGVRKNE
jgi:hypothetical protein